MVLNPQIPEHLCCSPPPQSDDHCIKILQKSITAYSRRSILWFWTYRQIHAYHKLSKFSLSPFALPPPKFWCWSHHRKHNLFIENDIFYRKTYISHLPYTRHHYFKILSNDMNFMNLGVLNLFTLHHCFLLNMLNMKPEFQNNRLQSGYILTQALIICETLKLT